MGQLLQQVSGALAAVFLITTALTGALAALNRGALQTARENADDLDRRVKILEAENERLVVERDTSASQNKVLRSVVTGEVKLTQIEDLLEKHHAESMTHWLKTEADIAAMRAAIDRPNERPKP